MSMLEMLISRNIKDWQGCARMGWAVGGDRGAAASVQERALRDG